MGLVILASSPYSSEFLVPGGSWSASGGFCYVFVCVGPAHLVFMEVVFYCSSSVSWVSGFCSWCVCSLLSVVLYTRGSVRSTQGLGPTMTTRGQSIGISIGMLPQTLSMSRLDQLS